MLYALITGGTFFGLNVSLMLYFMEGREPQAVLGTLIPFVILTEEKRYKPWMEHYAKEYSDPSRMEQIVLGFLIGFQYSWVIFIFAVVGEMFIEYRM